MRATCGEMLDAHDMVIMAMRCDDQVGRFASHGLNGEFDECGDVPFDGSFRRVIGFMVGISEFGAASGVGQDDDCSVGGAADLDDFGEDIRVFTVAIEFSD